ncbi:MAG TPA: hypothetical protein VI731_10930 [Bacteroidia bacterium]|nr:hypothetical protein [Bacteroidia bacterium]
MFIRYARANNPFALILIFLLGALLWVPGFSNPEPPAPTVYAPLYAGLDIFLRAHPWFSVIAAFLVVITAALFLNFLIHEHHILVKKSWMPALIFMVLSACAPELLWLHPPLIAGLFLLGALHLLLGTYRADKAYAPVFNAGLLIGIGGLFYVPVLVYIGFSLTVFILLRPFIWREWVIFSIGALLPWLYAGVWYFWHNRLDEVTSEMVLNPIAGRDFFLKISPAYYGLMFMLAFLLAVAISRFTAGAGSSTLKTKKAVSVMVWFFIFGLAAVIPAQSYHVTGFTFVLIPVAVFISKYFIVSRRLWLAESFFLLLLLSIGLSYAINRNLF